MKEKFGCSGCKISMFCGHKDEGVACETSLKAVAIAFVIPLIAIVVILAVGQLYFDEILSALAILCFLILYFLAIRLIKPKF